MGEQLERRIVRVDTNPHCPHHQVAVKVGLPDESKMVVLSGRALIAGDPETRVRLEATGEIGGVPVTARTLVEFDGMIYIELVFGPRAATSVPKLALAMPVKTEHAWLYHHFGKGGAVAEKENRKGPLKGNADVPARSFWLGTPDHGVTFFSPSFENWKLKGNRAPGHVTIDGPVTNYTVTVAKSAYPIKPGMRIALGFIATPVRP